MQNKGNLEILLNEFTQAIQGQPVVSDNAAMSVIVSLFLAAIIGTYLAIIYHFTYTGKKDNRGQMVYTLILLCLGGALVWLIVADHLVRAFGLAGALAMIRYRTRMQDPKDTTMVFFAIILGMACGLHQYFIAVYGAAFVGLVLWLIKLTNDFTYLSRPSTGGEKRVRPVTTTGNTESIEDVSVEDRAADDGGDPGTPEDGSVIIETNIVERDEEHRSGESGGKSQ